MIWLKLNIQSSKLHYSFVKLRLFRIEVLKLYFDITLFQINPWNFKKKKIEEFSILSLSLEESASTNYKVLVVWSNL